MDTRGLSVVVLVVVIEADKGRRVEEAKEDAISPAAELARNRVRR